MPYFPLPATIQDEGIEQGEAKALNFVGAGVSVATADGTATVTIAGGGGGAQAEVDFGTDLYQQAKSFTVTDAGVSPSSKIVVYQALTAATGKSQDENEMDALSCRATPGTGNFTVHVQSLTGSVAGAFTLVYIVA